MPNGKTHMAVGAGAGLLSLAIIPPERLTVSLAVLLGRTIGGLAGGCVPDRLEPAIGPRHRPSAHSVTSVGGVSGLCVAARQAEASFLDRAAELSERAKSEPDTIKQILMLVAANTLRFIGSVLVGGAVGYLLHLVLDFFTSAGLPLI